MGIQSFPSIINVIVSFESHLSHTSPDLGWKRGFRVEPWGLAEGLTAAVAYRVTRSRAEKKK
jgi:hypothetical protein